ncbi:MAG: DUF2269 domain-containing protein [Rhodanobacter sp.]|jgi:uncharacterized membrane protein|nr:DUF2269 domain-containing protein [Rhodanobacter sp.]
MEYLAIKALHILCATVLFGTGLGTAFFFWFTYRSGNVTAIAHAARLTVLADWVFTTPAVIAQPVTGLWLLHLANLDWRTGWVRTAIGLYLLTGACWLMVVWLQRRMRDLAATAMRNGTALPPVYRRYVWTWFVLGWPAFIAMLAVFWVMVVKPVAP